MDYDAWFKEVDKLCFDMYQMDSIAMTGDWESRSTYDSGTSPEEALHVVYNTANAFGEMDDWNIPPPP